MSKDLPIGTVTKVTPDTNTTYEICVRAAYNDKGFQKGKEYCKGYRDKEEARLCQPGKRYPECKEN